MTLAVFLIAKSFWLNVGVSEEYLTRLPPLRGLSVNGMYFVRSTARYAIQLQFDISANTP
jgi:hypothetical protein